MEEHGGYFKRPRMGNRTVDPWIYDWFHVLRDFTSHMCSLGGSMGSAFDRLPSLGEAEFHASLPVLKILMLSNCAPNTSFPQIQSKVQKGEKPGTSVLTYIVYSLSNPHHLPPLERSKKPSTPFSAFFPLFHHVMSSCCTITIRTNLH